MNSGAFRYRARTLDGRIVSGTLMAPSSTLAASDLRRRPLFIMSLVPARAWQRNVPVFARGGASRRRAQLAFFRSFATLLKAGVSIQRALTVAIERCTDAVLAETLRAVLSDVEAGRTLSIALARRPRDFSSLYVAMIGAGENGGILDDVLERIAEVLEREHAMRKKLQGVLAYPAVIALASGMLLVFLLTKIVPMFAGLFANFGVPLPLATRVLLWLGTVAGNPALWLLIVALLGCAAALAFRLVATPRGRVLAERVKFSAPVVGGVMRSAVVARVARMLGVLLRSGVGILDALAVVAPVAGSRLYENALKEIEDALRRGESFHRQMVRSGVFDPLAVALVGVGEETGRMDEMLMRVAAYLDVDIEAALATIAAVLEPALILGLGVLVGFIVFSIFIPLYSMIGSIT